MVFATPPHQTKKTGKKKRKKVYMYSQSSHNMFPKSWTQMAKMMQHKRQNTCFCFNSSPVNQFLNPQMVFRQTVHVRQCNIYIWYMIHNKIAVIYVRFIYILGGKQKYKIYQGILRLIWGFFVWYFFFSFPWQDQSITSVSGGDNFSTLLV
jgi:hypothetical protein